MFRQKVIKAVCHVKISRERNILINEHEHLNSSWGLEKEMGKKDKLLFLVKTPRKQNDI